MQKVIIKLGVVFTLITLFSLPQQVNAFGIGVYIPVHGSGGGNGTLSWDSFEYNDVDFDFDSDHAGIFGIVLDTKLARRGVFNYRINLGLERGTNDYITNDDGDFNRYVFDNTFGFGIVQTRVIRLWLGPQLRIAAISSTDEGDSYTMEFSGAEFGLAPVLGINVNLGRVITLAADMGYRFSGLAGSWDYSDDYYGSSNGTFTMSEKTFFFNLSFIFRMGDVFDGGASDYDEDKPDYDEEYY